MSKRYHITYYKPECGYYNEHWTAHIYIMGITNNIYSYVSEKDLIKKVNKYILKSYCQYFCNLFFKISLTNYLLIALILILLFKK